MLENDRIREVRKAKKLTLEKFGEKVGVQKSAISKIEHGENAVSDQIRLAVCREFDVNEHWLRTGEGDMFIQKSRSDEIAAFMGDILRDDTDFRQKFVSALARMNMDEWKMLEKMVLGLAEEIKKADPDGSAQ
ncbi:MAG: helix-turn-helix domain-containing protein [Oscillospiraceae bacterium]|nr:helix-turn-helix domain-containing protein [Oscillospiraceae bacterium]